MSLLYMAILVASVLANPCVPPIPNCGSCDITGTRCEFCPPDFFIINNGRACGWPCNTTPANAGGKNPNYIEHSVNCYSANYPYDVGLCEDGYSSCLGDKKCCPCSKAGIDSSKNHCLKCYFEYGTEQPYQCNSCQAGWAGRESFCSEPADCMRGNGSISGCTSCVTAGSTQCATCKANYRLFGGGCIPAALDSENAVYYVANCTTVSETDPTYCTGCIEGLGTSYDNKACVPCQNNLYGDVSQQHCIICDTYSSGVSCSGCSAGYLNTATFCNKTPTCNYSYGFIVGCLQCGYDNPLRCDKCDEANAMYNSPDGRQCMYGCNYSAPINPYFIDKCLECYEDYSTVYTAQCGVCTTGYSPSTDRSLCVQCINTTIGPASGQHCALCTTGVGNTAIKCTLCADGWTNRDGFCDQIADCKTSETPIDGCKECGTGPKVLECAQCEDAYELNTTSGQCIPKCTMSKYPSYFIEGCMFCRSSTPTTCAKCSSGYGLSSNKKQCVMCTNSSLGPASSQHCSQCDEYGTSGFKCTYCAEGWYDPANFCNTTSNCLFGTSQVYYCKICTTSNTILCAQCDDYYYVTDGGYKCEPGCTANLPSNPYFIKNCQSCYGYTPSKCYECAAGYTVSSDGFYCATTGECYPPIAGCATCESGSTTKCITCKPGYVMVNKVCSIQCGGVTKDYCTKCSTTDPSRCSACSNGFFLHTDNRCLTTGCYDVTLEGNAIECHNAGVCDYTSTTPSCTCTNTSLTWSSSNCACSSSYPTSITGECTMLTSCAYPAENCLLCYIYSSSASCSSCRSGFAGRYYLCKNKWEGCETYPSYDEGCEKCAANYVKWSGYLSLCVPNKTCTETSMPYCAWCNGYTCTKCVAGFTGLANGCNIACNAGPGCLQCDPTDPKVCIECELGLPPYCIHSVLCADGTSRTIDGQCVPNSCITRDLTYYNNYYGPILVANKTCANHGQCIGTGTSAHCQCESSLWDAASKCLACISGYHIENNNCVANTAGCSSKCFMCDASGRCLSCNPGYTNTAANCNTACTEGGCAVCDAVNPSVCTQCRSGYEVSSSSFDRQICQPYCPDGCDSLYCARSVEGTSMCVPFDCYWLEGTGDTVKNVCNYRGTCDFTTKKCVCTAPNTSPTSGSCGCNPGYGVDLPSSQCVPTISGCPSCTSDRTCVLSGGYMTCIPTKCVVGGQSSAKICNNAGLCGSHGGCVCDDPLKDPASKCVSCIFGYFLAIDGVTCQKIDCKTSNAVVRMCTECDPTEPTRCLKCAPPLYPSFTGRNCTSCLDDLKPRADGTGCECVDSSKKFNSAGECVVVTCNDPNCKYCSKKDVSKCGECKSGYYLTASGTCGVCPPGQVPSADQSVCRCPPGQEFAGDSPTTCIVPSCHMKSTKISNCMKCMAANPTQCHTCREGTVLSTDGKKCVCPAGTEYDTNGECAVPLCKTGATAIPRCTLCYAADNTKCGNCQAGYIPNGDRSSCGCVFGMELSPSGACIIPECKVGSTIVANCVKCLDSAPKKCMTCAENYTLSLDQLKCECTGSYGLADNNKCMHKECISEVSGCTKCRSTDTTRCASCSNSAFRPSEDGRKCEGCPSDKVLDNMGNCVCAANRELSTDGTCVIPYCKTGDSPIQFCTKCKGSPSTACGECSYDHVPSLDTMSCVCPNGKEEGDDRKCISPACKSIYGCVTCRSSSPTTCAKCIEGMYAPSSGTSCNCNSGTEFADDKKTCIVPKCKTGTSAVAYCDACKVAETSTCGRCSGERQLSSDGKTCACPAPTEASSDGKCITPQCKHITDCDACLSTDTTKCGLCKRGMRPFNDYTRCACADGEEIIGTNCARPTCTSGSTAVPGCIECGYVVTQCVACKGAKKLVNNECKGSALNGGAIAGIIIAVLVVAVGIVLAVIFLTKRKDMALATRSHAKYVDMHDNSDAVSNSM